jgi:hypothetical protein
MTPARPVLQFSVLCLNLVEEANRPPTLQHLFYELPCPQLPMRMKRFHLVNGWTNGQGRFAQMVRILHPDRTQILVQTGDQEVALENSECFQLIVNVFAEIQFIAAGTYWVQCFLDGELVLEYPLTVRLVQDPKNLLLAELVQRLQSLDCLALATKGRLLAHARDCLGVVELKAYLGETLPFVELHIASVTDSGFRALCQDMARLVDIQEVVRGLGIDGASASAPRSWLDMAVARQLEPCECLYCLANHYASHSDPNDSTTNAVGLTLLAAALGHTGQSEDAVQLLESFAGLGMGDYASAVALAARLDLRLHQELQLAPNDSAIYVLALADTLRSVARSEHAVQLLEGFLGLRAEDYASAAALTARLDQRLRQELDVEPDNAARYVQSLADALEFVGRSEHAGRLQESTVGLRVATWPGL